MVASRDPVARKDVKTGREYTHVHHDLPGIVAMLVPDDRFDVIRTAGRPAPFDTLTVREAGPRGVVAVSDDGSKWRLDPSSQSADLDPEFTVATGREPVSVELSGPGGSTRLRSIAIRQMEF